MLRFKARWPRTRKRKHSNVQVTITKELILAGRSSAGGWTREQLRLLGVDWPPRKKWQREIIGRTISKADAEEFVGLRGELGASKAQRNARRPQLENRVAGSVTEGRPSSKVGYPD
ncbi:MAG: hypothetical protein WB607_13960 [Candidatus Acidiferrum sp.]